VWSDNWEQWQHFYAMAYLCARDYGVVRYQTYNEPDQSTASAQRTPAEWVAGMKLAADAVRTAIADVNRIYGKNYVADISGPTKIGGADSASGWTSGRRLLRLRRGRAGDEPDRLRRPNRQLRHL
jgi:hypothetical protein